MATTTTGTASWGVNATCDGVTGVITDFEVTEVSSMAPEYNEVGAICQMTMYDKVTTINATVEVAKSVNPPETGDAITIGGHAGYVKEARITESNQAYRKIAITAELTQNVNTTTKAS